MWGRYFWAFVKGGRNLETIGLLYKDDNIWDRYLWVFVKGDQNLGSIFQGVCERMSIFGVDISGRL